MGPMLQRLAGICAFRYGPQDLPHSPSALVATIAASALLGYLAASNFPETTRVAAQVAVATLFALVFLYVVLAATGRQPRFVQTATALFGCDALVNVPVLLLSFPIALQGPEVASGAAIGIVLLWLWYLAILGHIFRNSLEIRLPLGVLLALAYSFLNFQVVYWAS